MDEPNNPAVSPAQQLPVQAPGPGQGPGLGVAMAPGDPGAHAGGGAEQNLNLLVYVRILLSYWWALGPLAIIGGVAGLGLSFAMQPLYRAECRYEIFENRRVMLAESEEITPYRGRGTINPLHRHIVLLNSGNLNQKVSDRLRREWNLQEEDAMLARFKLVIAPVQDVEHLMLDIKVDSFDGQYSLDYISYVLEGYYDLRVEETAQEHENSLVTLKRTQGDLGDEMARLQEQMFEFETQHQMVFNEKKSSSEVEHLTQLLENQRNVRTQRTILESQFPFLKDADVLTLQGVIDLTAITSGSFDADPSARAAAKAVGWSEIPEWHENEATVKRLEADYAYLGKTCKPAHPKMLQLEEQIAAANRELEIMRDLTMRRLVTRQEALKMQESALLQAAEGLQTRMVVDTAATARYEILKSRLEHLKEMHDKVFSAIMESSKFGTDPFFSRVVEGPTRVEEAVWPVKWKMVAIGVILSSALGVGLVLLVFFRRIRLYNYELIEMGMRVPCLAGVPKISSRDVKSSPMFLNELPKSSLVCECYRTLRTAVEHHLGEAKTLIVTSPEPGDGKTFTSLNMANVFSWSSKKTLIVDGDFRKVSLRRVFPDAAKEGLVDCLKEDGASWRNYIFKNVTPNLDYLPGGHSNESVTELLGGGKLVEVFAEMKEVYDVIVIDSAPVSHVVDTIVMAKHADAVVVVASTGKTSVNALRYALSRLSAANVIGFIRNNITEASRKYSYYYSGGHYYSGGRYYYSYASHYPGYYYYSRYSRYKNYAYGSRSGEKKKKGKEEEGPGEKGEGQEKP